MLPLLVEPRDDAGVFVLLRRLTENIGVKQPAHSFARKYSRRRGGRSSMGTGHCSRTASQSPSRLIRRKTFRIGTSDVTAYLVQPRRATAPVCLCINVRSRSRSYIKANLASQIKEPVQVSDPCKVVNTRRERMIAPIEIAGKQNPAR